MLFFDKNKHKKTLYSFSINGMEMTGSEQELHRTETVQTLATALFHALFYLDTRQ